VAAKDQVATRQKADMEELKERISQMERLIQVNRALLEPYLSLIRALIEP
jgi:hypothetical protein